MRHRFVLGNQQLCRENFGGAAQCLLPIENAVHYADDQHPYQGDGNRECSWALQEQGAQAITCGADREDQVHQFPEAALWDSRDPITVHMEYPVEEMPTRVMQDRPMPTYGGDSPEGVGILTWEQQAALEEEAEGYRRKLLAGVTDRQEQEKDYDWKLFGPEETLRQDEQSFRVALDEVADRPLAEWELACKYLEDPKVGLLYGPWPVRKFVLEDLPETPEDSQYAAYWEALGALNTLGIDYALEVYRPEGRSWRCAVVTWGIFLGLDIPSVCDEMATQYGS